MRTAITTLLLAAGLLLPGAAFADAAGHGHGDRIPGTCANEAPALWTQHGVQTAKSCPVDGQQAHTWDRVAPQHARGQDAPKRG